MPIVGTPSIINSNTQVGPDVIKSTNILDGEIVNADVASSAAIAKSKIDLGTGLVNADIAAAAAIARTKLDLGTGLVDADIAAAAAIAGSKIQQVSVGANAGVLPSTGVANATVAAAAGIVDTKLATISTAGKVQGDALTLLGNIPAGAGTVPAANLPSAAMKLLKAGSGASAATGSTLLDSVAITGLTALDTILIFYTVSQETQTASGNDDIRNTTDAKILAELFYGTPPGIGNSTGGMVMIRQEQKDAQTVFASVSDNTVALATKAATGGSPSAGKLEHLSTAVTTAWTGSWTLGFQFAGQTSGGTHRWSWSVFKILGQ